MMAGLLPLLLSLLLAVSPVSAQVFLSIDCGASAPHTDGNGIDWVVDGSYVEGGKGHSVANTSSDVPRSFATLRAFTSRKKNCYTIPVTGGGQILVRASFYYGNYDGKASPPTFDLLFDGTTWGTVQTTADGLLYSEAIYVVDGGATSVCVAQTKPGQIPFVSTVEVRSLDLGMYPNFETSSWLLMQERLAFGAARLIRYPDDPYDRIWSRGAVGQGLTLLRNETVIEVSSLYNTDRPPAAVFQAAVGTNSTLNSISVSPGLPPGGREININFYFAEMLQLDLNAVRTVQVTMDGQLIANGIIALSEQGAQEFSAKVTANANTAFVVRAAPGSKLPPIISAFEVYTVGDVRRTTDAGDVGGLDSLKQLWPVLNGWTGDPCLPTEYSWEWVGCTSDDQPRITALKLSGFGLSGELPEFSSVALDQLEKIDLHNNSLSGPIPVFLGYLTNLKELNLADNNFSGTIPTSLSENTNIKLDVSGNPNLCESADSCSGGGSFPGTTTSTAASPGKKKSSNTGLIVGITVPLVVVFLAAVGAVVYLHQKKTAAALAATPGKPNGFGAPSGPPSRPPPPATAADGGQRPPAAGDYRIEIEQQMGSELADLMAQQAQQHYEAGRSPSVEPEQSLLRRQQE